MFRPPDGMKRAVPINFWIDPFVLFLLRGVGTRGVTGFFEEGLVRERSPEEGPCDYFSFKKNGQTFRELPKRVSDRPGPPVFRPLS